VRPQTGGPADARRRAAGVCHRRKHRRAGPLPAPHQDLVQRRFVADAPARLWCTDLTEHPTADGKVYCAAVLDVFTRQIVGWSIADHLRAELVVDALEMVLVFLGLRRSEALDLRWVDVDLDAEKLDVRYALHREPGGLVLLPPKTRRSRRTIPLPAPLAEVLRVHQTAQEAERAKAGPDWMESGHVFTTAEGMPLDPRNTTRLFQLQPPESRWCRSTRSGTCVSLLLSLGESPRTVMEIAGHSALEMTMNVYGHVALDSRRQALSRLADLIGE
jgi:integrase